MPASMLGFLVTKRITLWPPSNSCNRWPRECRSRSKLKNNNSFWSARISKKNSQRHISTTVVISNQEIEGDQNSANYRRLWFQKACSVFHWKTRIVSFLTSCLTNSRLFLRMMIKILSESMRSLRHEWRLLRNLVSIFQVQMSHLDEHKKRWISPTPFNRFSSSFHQNDRTVAALPISVTEEITLKAKVTIYKNFSARIFLETLNVRSRWR